MTEATSTRVRDLAGSGHPSPADAIRLIAPAYWRGERRDDGHVWVRSGELDAAHDQHGARRRAGEVARFALERSGRDPVTPRHKGA